ncbi:hypothetical protein PCH_Pc22g01680 [Penicillium rubens Wisconsin 54-1255]|uniref:Uncharacterized protein n=1 Tax=Penicillium rubens (strain ATCC 28089 / DSM 1075 / NRRL 1951 / Wisconsin 54-1255) TaxID=500485 RepID=B6HP12_PENRW|nr:hypothetical protein PCH_Pc22g01680 [Penicillium rubens Wisconsin 54-1255]
MVSLVVSAFGEGRAQFADSESRESNSIAPEVNCPKSSSNLTASAQTLDWVGFERGTWSYEAPGGEDVTGTASRPRRPRWDAKITGQGVCQVGSRYQAQSLRTWHVSGIDGDDARVHGEDEPRRRSGVILCGITTGEPGETAGRRGSGGAESFEAAPANW